MTVKTFNCIWLCALIFLFLSCSKDEFDATLNFVGDSMVANWDVEASFPNRLTKNYGRDGAVIDYIEDIHLTNGDVILLIGTNDLRANMNEEQVKDYAEKYEKVVSKFSTGRIILVSILPTNDVGKNENIKVFNALISEWASSVSHIDYIDCYNRLHGRDGLIRSDLTREGLHLNDYGYIILTDAVQEVI